MAYAFPKHSKLLLPNSARIYHINISYMTLIKSSTCLKFVSQGLSPDAWDFGPNVKNIVLYRHGQSGLKISSVISHIAKELTQNLGLDDSFG